MEIERVIITGGTSGLGLELVKLFLERGSEVLSLGRSKGKLVHPLHTFYKCDFASLGDVRETARQIAEECKTINLIINNAGILSPPEHTKSIDGFELSYQVNFLAHVYFYQLLMERGILNNTMVINTTSPIRTHGKLEQDWIFNKNAYGSIKAYASTKLYMSLFSSHIASKGLASYAFDPGTFRSGIYRAQKPWFHTLYKIGAPFLIHSKHVARDFVTVFDRNDRLNGVVYNRKGRAATQITFDENRIAGFWERVNQQLSLNGSKID